MRILSRIGLGFLCLYISACAAIKPAHAQFLGQTSPQTVTQQVLNAVTGPIVGPAWDVTKTSCTPAVGAACAIQNLGQNFHILTYTSSSSTAQFQLRLEGSIDGTNYFPISDDATGLSSGAVVAQGYYPSVRVNLAAYSGSGTITAFYSGTSTGSFPITGVLNQSQSYRKLLALNATGTGSTQSFSINPPCGNSSGTLVFQYTAGAGAGSVQVETGFSSFALFQNLAANTTLASNTMLQTFPVRSQAATFIYVQINAAAASTYTLNYLFNCPAGDGATGPASVTFSGPLQPPNLNNSETVSATNTPIVITLPGLSGTQIALYSVSARCSAGTAGLSVENISTNIWSTGSGEVGTTTFRYQWDPGLTLGNGNPMIITLTSCGAGNTGTLDVQASQN